MTRNRCAVGVLQALMVMGCVARPTTYDVTEAMQLYRQGEWDKATVAFKQQLRSDPTNPGGHLFLGICYLNAENPWLVLAENECALALRLFTEQGGRSPIPEYPDDYFEIRCNLELAKVTLTQLDILIDGRSRSEVLQPYFDRCQAYAERVRVFAAGSKDMIWLDGKIAERRTRATAHPQRGRPVQTSN